MKKLLIFIMTATVLLNITAYAYNKDLSLDYASAHFDDGKGLCAEFVADCLSAGGMEIGANECNDLVKELTKNYPIYPLIVEENGKISMSRNEDILAVGDVLAQECHECGGFFHVVLVGGEHKDFITYYAHNAPHGNTEGDIFYNVPNYEHKGHTSVVYSIHFPEEKERLNLSYTLYTVEAENGLNMRTTPSTDGGVLTTIPDKTVLTVFPDLSKEDWCYTAFQNKKGYVKKDFLCETVIHKETDISITVEEAVLDEKPVIIEGRALLPVRAIFEALGGQVSWNDDIKTATIAFGEKTVTLKHLDRVMKTEKGEKDLIVPSVIIEGKMYVGARGVSEGLEKTVKWENGTVTIN